MPAIRSSTTGGSDAALVVAFFVLGRLPTANPRTLELLIWHMAGGTLILVLTLTHTWKIYLLFWVLPLLTILQLIIRSIL